MKRTIILALSIAFAIGSTQAQKAVVKGTLDKATTGVTEIIVSKIVNSNIIPDTVKIDKGNTFKYEVVLDQPALFLIGSPSFGQSVVHIMLHPKDNIQITIGYDSEQEYLRLLDAKGSRDVAVYQSFNQQLYQFNKQAKKLDSEYRTRSASDSRKMEIADEFQQLHTSANIAIRKLLSDNSDVLVSAFLVTYFENDLETYIDLYESIERGLSKKYGDNQFVQHVSSKVKTSLAPGKLAPEITMKDPEGQTRKLSDLRGKIVMIDFWASWCRPCRMENPNVVKLYHQYHSKGFEIYSVSLDKSRDEWVKAISQDGLVWENHVSDLNGWTSTGGAAYGITSVPSTVLLDREGRIIARNLRGRELENKLKELFGE